MAHSYVLHWQSPVIDAVVSECELLTSVYFYYTLVVGGNPNVVLTVFYYASYVASREIIRVFPHVEFPPFPVRHPNTQIVTLSYPKRSVA